MPHPPAPTQPALGPSVDALHPAETAAALYASRSQAERAVHALQEAGLEEQHIRVEQVTPAQILALVDLGPSPFDRFTRMLRNGLVAGAIIGGLFGFILSMAALVVPGIEAVASAGPFYVSLLGAGIASTLGVFYFGFREGNTRRADMRTLKKQGGLLVTIHVPPMKLNAAIKIFNLYYPIDLKDQVAEWRTAGWEGYTANGTTDYRADDAVHPGDKALAHENVTPNRKMQANLQQNRPDLHHSTA